ncbi:MAG: alpha/beta hydrolase [Spirochaetota bacterium]
MKPRLFVMAGTVTALGIVLSLAACSPVYKPGSLSGLEAVGKLVLDPPEQSQDPWTTRGDWELEPGVMIRHVSEGKGPAVLVLHGGPGAPSDQAWEGLSSLEGRWLFVYPQTRGSGSSTRTVDRWESGDWSRNVAEMEARLGLSAQVADIERTRRLLGLEKLTIIAHSYGGLLALLYAVEFPSRVERLVLVSPATMLRMPPPAGADLYSLVEAKLSGQEKESFIAWKKRFFDYSRLWSWSEADWRAANEDFLPYFIQASSKAGASWGSEPLPLPAGGLGGWVQPASFFSLGRDYDLRPLAAKLSCPVRLLVGDRDLIPSVAWEDWRHSIPDLREYSLEGAGHFPMRDGRFAALVARALEE